MKCKALATMIFVIVAAVGVAAPAHAAPTLPAGFSDEVQVSGLNLPTAFAFAPDGRLFVAEQRGVIKVYDDLDDTTPTVFADLRRDVHNYFDNGLLGLVVDPQWPERPYVYIEYIADAPVGGTTPTYGAIGVDSDPCPDSYCPTTVRVARLVVDDDTIPTQVILLQDECHPRSHHGGGGMAFGADGALYVSIGESAGTVGVDYGVGQFNPCGDPPTPQGTPPSLPSAEGGTLRSQDLRTSNDPAGVSGALIRIDPNTGAGWPSNPWATSSDLAARKVIAYGLRNPFRLTMRPGTNEAWVADVGWAAWDEINRVADPGGVHENFGWPCYEGFDRQPSYDALDLSICEILYADSIDAASPPYYTYHHDVETVPGDGCPIGGGGATTGISFYNGGGYPARYVGGLFFADIERRCIWFMPKAANGLPNPAAVELFAKGLGKPVDLRIGPGGDLFYLDIAGGALRRIHYDPSNTPPTPVIDAMPPSGAPPLAVTLDASRSSDPDPDEQLQYAWDTDNDGAFDDATTITTQKTFMTRGAHTVRLRVTDHTGTARTASTIVTVGNAPAVTLDTPTSATQWSSGEQLTFSGHATDPEDGAVPPAQLAWSLILHHCYSSTDCHQHHIEDFAGAGGSLIAPDHEYLAKLELQLTATDSDGVQDTESVTIDPRLVSVTFQSVPSGMKIAVGAKTRTTPFTTPLIVGSTASVTAVSPESVDGFVHGFSSWSDGGAATHEFTVGATNATYTATFENLSRPPIANAGADQTVNHKKDFIVDGTASSDPDGDPLEYEWVQISGPLAVIPDNRLSLASVQGVKGPATLTFQLTVTDSHGLSHGDVVTVTVRPK